MLHGVFVGAGGLRDSRLESVPTARRDAEAMYARVAASAADPRHLTFLVGERATKATIERLLTKELPSRITEDDAVLLYFAGAGHVGATTAQADPSTLLLTYDTSHTALRASSLDLTAEVSTWMQSMGARLVMLVIDATFAVKRRCAPAEGGATWPPAPPATPRWTSMAVGSRCAVLSSTSNPASTSDSKGTERRTLTTNLLSAIAEAPEGTLITPALLHAASTSEAPSDVPRAEPSVLVGSSLATHAALFRTR
ncbi:hypothetical protein BH11MYX4_BH11MYX4_45190 [soil metagenome]